MDARSLSWPEVKMLATSGAVALLPIGSTEAHGPHLPLSTDVLIAEEVCRRVDDALVARGQSCVRFPAVAYGVTDFASGFAGTITLPGEVFEPFLRGVFESIAKQGFQTVCAVNHHLEPAHFRCVHAAAKAAKASSGVSIVVADHRKADTTKALGEEFHHGGSHAGFYETSLMLASEQGRRWVHDDVRRALPDLDSNLPELIKAGKKRFEECGAPNAYLGRPGSATAEEGNRLYSVLVDLVLKTIPISAT
jgi:creatinine amidohydrolase